MTTPSPICTVNGSVTPVDVSASSTIAIALASPAGARFWSVSCTSTDELSSSTAINATITINQTNKTAAATFPSTVGTAYIFTSTVGILGLGLDANGIAQAYLSTTFKVNVKAGNGARVLAENETFEQNAQAGWIAEINAIIRAGTSIPTTIGSTGFAHVTSGSIDANARAVNLASNGAGGDVTGIVPWANGGRLQGIIHVVNGTPGVLSNVVQVAMMESNTGTTSVSIPTASQFGGSIPDGFSFLVADTGGVAATSNITVTNAGAVGIVDPGTGTKVTGNVTLKSNYASAYWTWDATESVFFIANGGSIGPPVTLIVQNNGASITQRAILDLNGLVYVDDSGGGRMRFFASAGAPMTGSSFTLSNAQPWGEIVGGGTYTLPASPVAGLEFVLTDVSGTTSVNPASLSGNGSNVTDPQTYTPIATASLRNSFKSFRFRHNGSLYRCTGVS